MRLTVVGCAGSFPGPTSPASSYLLQAEDRGGRTWSLVLDLGNGALGALQRHADPFALDAVAISHLHPDHFLDLCGLHVYRRYHPTRGAHRAAARADGADAVAPLLVLGPSGTAARTENAYGKAAGENLDATYRFVTWQPGATVGVGPFGLQVAPANHPIEAYALRVTGPSDTRPGERVTLVYTGDTDASDDVTLLAEGADVLLAEAAFEEGRDDGVRGVHLTGRRAGELARDARAGRLLLTHLPAWNTPGRAEEEAAAVYAGPVEAVTHDAVYTL